MTLQQPKLESAQYFDLVQQNISEFNNKQDILCNEYSKTNGLTALKNILNGKTHHTLKARRETSYELNAEEKKVLQNNGYFVKPNTQNVSQKDTFCGRYLDIYNNDLPVIITTDSMLHAYHRAYEQFIKTIDEKILAPRLKSLCSAISDDITNFQKNPVMKSVKTIFEVPRWLLANIPVVRYSWDKTPDTTEKNHSDPEIDTYIQSVLNCHDMILNIAGTKIQMMGTMFKPRGHYVESELLKRYFMAFTWLSKFNVVFDFSPEKRMELENGLFFASLITKVCEPYLERIEMFLNVIKMLIGEPDGFDVKSFLEFMQTSHVKNTEGIYEKLCNTKSAYTDYFIEYLKKNPGKMCKFFNFNLTDDLRTIGDTSCFGVLGKGNSIDNEIMSELYDAKFKTDDGKSGLVTLRKYFHIMDVFYTVFNNDAAKDILVPLMHKPQKAHRDGYKYGKSLEELRNKMNVWMNNPCKTAYGQHLRLLNTLSKKDFYAQWPFSEKQWSKKMLNTQMGSYNELLHDNVLYANELCGGGTKCSYPDLIVEPNLEFWTEFKKMIGLLTSLGGGKDLQCSVSNCVDDISKFGPVIDMIIEMNKCQLNKTKPSDELLNSLKSIVFKKPAMSGGYPFGGWYFKLVGKNSAFKYKPEVSSYFTAIPDDRDEGGIQCMGTGRVQVMYVLTNHYLTNTPTLYVGPVYSAYEFTTEYKDRLNDDDWGKRVEKMQMFNCN